MHLILTGATGLVGAAALDAMLNLSTVTRISILSRRPVPMVDASENKEKVKLIIHQDFGSYDSAVLEQLKGADGCVWALGVSQNAVEKRSVPPPCGYYNITVSDIYCPASISKSPRTGRSLPPGNSLASLLPSSSCTSRAKEPPQPRP